MYTVELRFSGSGLVCDEISARLGLSPAITWVGPAASAPGGRGKPIWAYNGQGEPGFQSEWKSLDDGLTFLVGRLLPLRMTVFDIARVHSGVWWCGHFQSAFDGGPMLSAQTLDQVASFGLPLFIDNYYSNS